MELPELNKRLKELINYYSDGNVADFARKIGVEHQKLNRNFNIDSRNKKYPTPSSEIIQKTLDNLDNVNGNWLISGSGSMLKDDNTPIYAETQEQYEKAIAEGLKMIPEVDFTFTAGPEIVLSDENIIRYWHLPDATDCDVIVPMAGASMLPTLPPGSSLALKRYSFDVRYPNQIPFGNTFAIVVEDLKTNKYHGHIKILRRHKDDELSKRFWIARSTNPDFDDFDIDISTVRSLWIVKQHVITDVIL